MNEMNENNIQNKVTPPFPPFVPGIMHPIESIALRVAAMRAETIRITMSSVEETSVRFIDATEAFVAGRGNAQDVFDAFGQTSESLANAEWHLTEHPTISAQMADLLKKERVALRKVAEKAIESSSNAIDQTAQASNVENVIEFVRAANARVAAFRQIYLNAERERIADANARAIDISRSQFTH